MRRTGIQRREQWSDGRCGGCSILYRVGFLCEAPLALGGDSPPDGVGADIRRSPACHAARREETKGSFSWFATLEPTLAHGQKRNSSSKS